MCASKGIVDANWACVVDVSLMFHIRFTYFSLFQRWQVDERFVHKGNLRSSNVITYILTWLHIMWMYVPCCFIMLLLQSKTYWVDKNLSTRLHLGTWEQGVAGRVPFQASHPSDITSAGHNAGTFFCGLPYIVRPCCYWQCRVMKSERSSGSHAHITGRDCKIAFNKQPLLDGKSQLYINISCFLCFNW